MTYRTALAIALIAIVSSASASAQAKEAKEWMALGWIGPYRVGVNLTIRDNTDLIAAHYFYAKNPIDIPLTVAVAGGKVTLREPGGGVFDLRFASNDKPATRPLSFYTSTALVGTWTGKGRVYPVRLDLTSTDRLHGADRYQNVTNASAPAFEALVQRFIHGAISGNRAKTASAVSFPLTVRDTKTYTVRNRAQLYARWKQVFTPCFIVNLKEAVPHEMFVRDEVAMVSDGAVWFNARGATFINWPSCFKD
ncbi:hypothetical protein ACVWZA_002505 [Sphingomonas sp. UYAg733]